MLELDKKYSDKQKVFDELLFGSGVVVFRNIFDLKKIEEARNITNHFANVVFLAGSLAVCPTPLFKKMKTLYKKHNIIDDACGESPPTP